MAVLIPEEKCLVLKNKNFFEAVKNTAGKYPGPVAPSAADWRETFRGLKRSARTFEKQPRLWTLARTDLNESDSNKSSQTNFFAKAQDQGTALTNFLAICFVF